MLDNIAILIPNFNGEKFILSTIQLLRNGFPGVKLLVVDDASTDNSACTLKHNSIDAIVRNLNGGFAASVNTGILELARLNYKYVLVCNSDLAPTTDQCNGIFDALNLYNLDKDLAVVGFLESTASSVIQYQLAGISGFLFWLKIDVMAHVGLFDERFYMYGEETDFFRRVLKNGFHIKQSGVRVLHLAEKSGKSKMMNSWYAIRNCIFLEAKNFQYLNLCKKVIALELVIIGIRGNAGDPSTARVRRPGKILGSMMLIASIIWNLFWLFRTGAVKLIQRHQIKE